MKNLIFLCIALAIFIFSVIVLNRAPTINGLIGKGRYEANGDATSVGWADSSCKFFSDIYNEYKELEQEEYWKDADNKELHLSFLKEGKSYCLRKKAMKGLEYSAFNFDVIFGFTCFILGFLLYSGNNIGKITGLIGLASGAIGFVLTFVYIIYSGMVFNNDLIDKDFNTDSNYLDPDFEIDPYSTASIAIDSDGAFMKWKDGKYVCIFYDKDNKDKLYRKYSNYGNKYLNYHHFNEKDNSDEYYKYKGCSSIPSFTGTERDFWEHCKILEESQAQITQRKMRDDEHNDKGDCDKLYLFDATIVTDEKKNLYDSWVLTIVLGCFIFVLDIGLAIFGLLIFNDSKGSS